MHFLNVLPSKVPSKEGHVKCSAWMDLGVYHEIKSKSVKLQTETNNSNLNSFWLESQQWIIKNIKI